MILVEVCLEAILALYAAYLFLAACRCNGCVVETWRLMLLMSVITYLVGSIVCELRWYAEGGVSPMHNMDPAAWQVLDFLDILIVGGVLQVVKIGFFNKCRWRVETEE